MTDPRPTPAQILARAVAALDEIVAVLGPTIPEHGCEGCEAEMSIALGAARPALDGLRALEWGEYDGLVNLKTGRMSPLLGVANGGGIDPDGWEAQPVAVLRLKTPTGDEPEKASTE